MISKFNNKTCTSAKIEWNLIHFYTFSQQRTKSGREASEWVRGFNDLDGITTFTIIFLMILNVFSTQMFSAAQRVSFFEEELCVRTSLHLWLRFTFGCIRKYTRVFSAVQSWVIRLLIINQKYFTLSKSWLWCLTVKGVESMPQKLLQSKREGWSEIDRKVMMCIRVFIACSDLNAKSFFGRLRDDENEMLQIFSAN